MSEDNATLVQRVTYRVCAPFCGPREGSIVEYIVMGVVLIVLGIALWPQGEASAEQVPRVRGVDENLRSRQLTLLYTKRPVLV